MYRERLTSSARQDISKLDYEIQTLMTGEGLVTGPNTPFALPLKIDLYEDYLKSLDTWRKEVRKPVDEGFFLTMRILQLADTHIGDSAYNKLDENGYNQREMDVYSAFSQVVDFALKEEPDLILHSGDLFDTVRPSNRAISFVMGQLLKISDTGIPMVIISGNHETPRLRETGSVFKVFEHVDNLHLAFTGKCQTFEFGDLKVHALPHNLVGCVAGQGGEGLIGVLDLHLQVSHSDGVAHTA